MKLPEDKKERTQVLVMIALGCVGVIYVSVVYGIQPMLKTKQANIEEIASLSAKMDTAHDKIKKMRDDRKANYKSVCSIIDVTDQYVIRPTLGENFLLGASKIIKEHATKTGTPEPAVRQVGHRDIEQNKRRSTPNAFKQYTVTVSLKCGVHQLQPFLRSLEESNPYLSISRLTIKLNPADKGKHDISFDVSWPRWVSLATRDSMKEQISKEEATQQKEAKK